MTFSCANQQQICKHIQSCANVGYCLADGFKAEKFKPGVKTTVVDEQSEHGRILNLMKEQLLIVFLKRLKEKYGDDLRFNVSEVDGTGQDLLSFALENSELDVETMTWKGTFAFNLSKKA